MKAQKKTRKHKERIRKTKLNERALINQITTYLWNVASISQLFKVSNLLLKTKYTETKFCLSRNRTDDE